ncbi:MAG TPA: hypothetical protein VFD45_03725 [Patescibacteria group bacterium]|nr:hypothetical protein [Patescibacteria group bacterium]
MSFERNRAQYSLIFNRDVAYAALPGTENVVESKIVTKDARIEILNQFFVEHKSPLLPYAEDVITAAEKYGLDWRLVPAIGMQESNLCKKEPKESYNCWGFGVYGKKVTRFDNYPQAIDIVSKALARDYIGQGLVSPQEIMSKYTPSNNGEWADSVTHFINQLK